MRTPKPRPTIDAGTVTVAMLPGTREHPVGRRAGVSLSITGTPQHSGCDALTVTS